MTDQSSRRTPRDLAIAFTEAWTSHDMTTAAGYLADDVQFDGPINHTTSAKAYMDGLNAFAPAVTGMKMLAAFGDDQQALIMYDLTTAFGTLTSAELLTFWDGKIVKDLVTFDAYAIRKAQGG